MKRNFFLPSTWPQKSYWSLTSSYFSFTNGLSSGKGYGYPLDKAKRTCKQCGTAHALSQGAAVAVCPAMADLRVLRHQLFPAEHRSAAQAWADAVDDQLRQLYFAGLVPRSLQVLLQLSKEEQEEHQKRLPPYGVRVLQVLNERAARTPD